MSADPGEAEDKANLYFPTLSHKWIMRRYRRWSNLTEQTTKHPITFKFITTLHYEVFCEGIIRIEIF